MEKSQPHLMAQDAATVDPSKLTALTPEVVVDWMRHVLDPIHGRVERWYLPGSHSLNFLLENALGGGGVASLRIDPQGKAFAQQLLEIQIPVPQRIADAVN